DRRRYRPGRVEGQAVDPGLDRRGLPRRATDLRAGFPAGLVIPEIDHPASGDIHQQRVGLDVAGQPAEALEVGPELVEPVRWRGVQRGEGAGTQNTIVLQGMLR